MDHHLQLFHTYLKEQNSTIDETLIKDIAPVLMNNDKYCVNNYMIYTYVLYQRKSNTIESMITNFKLVENEDYSLIAEKNYLFSIVSFKTCLCNTKSKFLKQFFELEQHLNDHNKNTIELATVLINYNKTTIENLQNELKNSLIPSVNTVSIGTNTDDSIDNLLSVPLFNNIDNKLASISEKMDNNLVSILYRLDNNFYPILNRLDNNTQSINFKFDNAISPMLDKIDDNIISAFDKLDKLDNYESAIQDREKIIYDEKINYITQLLKDISKCVNTIRI